MSTVREVPGRVEMPCTAVPNGPTNLLDDLRATGHRASSPPGAGTRHHLVLAQPSPRAWHQRDRHIHLGGSASAGGGGVHLSVGAGAPRGSRCAPHLVPARLAAAAAILTAGIAIELFV